MVSSGAWSMVDSMSQGGTLPHRQTVGSYRRQSFAVALRIVVAGGCVLAIWCSWKVARADYLYGRDTADALRSAIQLAPDKSEYYVRLAQIDDAHAPDLLETALRLNQYNAQAATDLGLRYEAAGDYPRAERLLLQASAVDHTYQPRWSLANFYLRRDNLPQFWAWARRAAEMPPDDMGALFDLCWRVSPNPDQIAAAILTDNPEAIRQYLWFLVRKNQLPAAANAGQRLIRASTPAVDRTQLFAVVNQLAAANQATAASALWQGMIERRWVVADKSAPNNPVFAREPLPVDFDWAIASYPGLHSWPGSSGLETEFTGDEPESCTIAEQTMSLAPGNYTMEYSYRTKEIPPETGIRWQIVDAKSGAVLANSPDLSSEAGKQESLAFSVPAGAPLQRLRLSYQRAIGTTRISGSLVVVSTGIQGHPSA
jgi:hypothetical protein